MPQTVTITLDRTAFEAERTKIAANGLTLTGDSGFAQSDKFKGIVIAFHYVEPTLSLQVVKHPFLEPEFAIDNAIEGFFKT